MKLYHASGSPNSRRVRILLAEKGLDVPLIPVDLGTREQFSDAYRSINPRVVVPTLVLDDGTAIGETPVIMRYLDDAFAQTPLFGTTAQEKAIVAMWERRAETRICGGDGRRAQRRGGAKRPCRFRAARVQTDSRTGRTQQAARGEFLRRSRGETVECPVRCGRVLYRRGHHGAGCGGLCHARFCDADP
ncbi:glutathione S-transferase [Paraburkholderia atlantica]